MLPHESFTRETVLELPISTVNDCGPAAALCHAVLVLESVAWAAVAPVVCDEAVAVPVDARFAYGVIDTLLKVDVLSVEELWLVTAKPMYTVAPIVMVADPTVVHVRPSVEL